MNSFKALVIKDLQANRKILMVPVWFVLAMYVMMLFSIIYAWASGTSNMSMNGIPVEFLSNPELHRMMSFLMHFVSFIGSLGLLFTVAMFILGSTLLNQDIKHKCELFHRSQPVSVWQITGSRFVAGIGGLILVSLAIGFVNMLLTNITAAILTPFQIDWWLSLNGLLLSWLHFSIAMLVLGSMLFLLSAIFRDHAFGLGIGGLGLLQLITFILNKLYGWNIPYILNAIFKLITSGIVNIQKVVPSMHSFGIVTVRTSEPDISNLVIPPHFIYNLWTTLFTWDIAFKLVFCAVLFIIATYVYKQREVQF